MPSGLDLDLNLLGFPRAYLRGALTASSIGQFQFFVEAYEQV